MSLQIWMPLNGSVDNQGVHPGEFIVNDTDTVTINSEGKIGACYNFDGYTGLGIMYGGDVQKFMDTYINNKTYSFCLWCKSSTTASMPLVQFTYSITLFTGTTIRYGISPNLVSATMTPAVWHHVTVVHDADNLKLSLYIDGDLKSEISMSSPIYSTHSNYVGLGRNTNNSTASTSYYYQGKINDFRFYDEALSPKQIKEISKGLVLHYPLNGNVGCGSNLLLKSNRYIHTTGYAMADYYFVSGEAPINGQTYTIQLKGELGEGRAYFGIYNSGGSASNTSLASAQLVDGIYTRTFTWAVSSSSNTYLRVYHMPSSATSYSTIEWIKLEPGSVATPYCLNHTEDGGGNVAHDCSGYKNDGTITGTLTTSSDSARYDLSTYTSSGDTNYITTPTLHLPGDAITMNFWFKSTNTTPGSNYHMPFEAAASSNQAYEMSIYKTGYLRGGLVIDGTRKVDNCTSTKLIDGSWHMCTMTYDGTTIRRYVDAVMEKSTAASGSLVTSSYFILGHYGTNIDYYSKEAYTSDVRLYTTALSESDIKELYETGQSIDNKGNIYAYEFVEE